MNEKVLAEYLLERERASSSTDTQGDYLPLFYMSVKSGYPTSGEYLGEGGCGHVQKVDWLGLTCAKKCLRGNTLLETDTKKCVKEILSVLAKLYNPHIVKLFCSGFLSSQVSFVMEYMPMSLLAFSRVHWRTSDTGKADWTQFSILAAIDMMLQIARGMEYLHEQGIVHRDLKSPNIPVAPTDIEELRDQRFVDVKVTDFGMAKVVDGNLSMPGVLQSVDNSTPWRAPEAYSCDLPIDWKRPMFLVSEHLTCSEILTGKIPLLGAWNVPVSIRRGERPVLPL